MTMETLDQNAGITVPGEAQPAPVIDTPAEDRQPSGDDIEARARAQGWVPREEFRGPPENWRDAGEFVRRGEEELPIVRERLRDATRKIADMQSTFDRRIATIEKMSRTAIDRHRIATEAAYEAALREAAANGDVTRFDQLSQDKRAALDAHDRQVEAVSTPPPGQAQPIPAPEVQAWVQHNPWFENDMEMRLVAVAHSQALEKQYPAMSLDENLRHVGAYMRKRYADKFGPATAPRPATVEGGQRFANTGQRTRGVNELPSEVRKIGDRFVSQGIYKDIKEYAQDYWAQEGV